MPFGWTTDHWTPHSTAHAVVQRQPSWGGRDLCTAGYPPQATLPSFFRYVNDRHNHVTTKTYTAEGPAYTVPGPTRTAHNYQPEAWQHLALATHPHPLTCCRRSNVSRPPAESSLTMQVHQETTIHWRVPGGPPALLLAYCRRCTNSRGPAATTGGEVGWVGGCCRPSYYTRYTPGDNKVQRTATCTHHVRLLAANRVPQQTAFRDATTTQHLVTPAPAASAEPAYMTPPRKRYKYQYQSLQIGLCHTTSGTRSCLQPSLGGICIWSI